MVPLTFEGLYPKSNIGISKPAAPESNKPIPRCLSGSASVFNLFVRPTAVLVLRLFTDDVASSHYPVFKGPATL